MVTRALLLLMGLAGSALHAASIYPMESGDLMRQARSLGSSAVQGGLSPNWIAPACLGTTRSGPVILTDRVITTYQGGCQAMARANGQVIWTQRGTGELYNPPAYDAGRDLLYFINMAGVLMAIRPSDGAVAWSLSNACVPGVRTMGSVIYQNDRIYFGDAGGKFRCVNADTRAPIWDFSYVIVTRSGSVTPAMDGNDLFICSVAGELCRLDKNSGSLVWRQDIGVPLEASLLLTPDRVFLMRHDGKVECRRRSDGGIDWTYQTESWAQGNMSTCGELLIATSDDRSVHGLNLLTGQLIWKRRFWGNFARSGAFTVCGYVFVSGCTGEFYGLDGRTGQTIWTYQHGGPHDNSFVDWGEADGHLYVSDREGKLYDFVATSPGDPLVCVCDLKAFTHTPTPQVSPTMSPTPAGSATTTSSPTRTRTPTYTQTPIPSSTTSPTPSVTPSLSPSPSPSPQLSSTPTALPTAGKDDPRDGDDVQDVGDDDVVVYPNPVRDGHCRVAYRMSKPGRARIKMFSASGEQVGRFEFEHGKAGLRSVECDVHAFAAGVYFLNCDRHYEGAGASDRTKLGKFLVIR